LEEKGGIKKRAGQILYWHLRFGKLSCKAKNKKAITRSEGMGESSSEGMMREKDHMGLRIERGKGKGRDPSRTHTGGRRP